jgi:hypothetical protein
MAGRDEEMEEASKGMQVLSWLVLTRAAINKLTS